MLLREYLTNIANAIRSKLGTTDKVNAQDFANKVNEVYDKGRNDEWSDFWDVYQNYGKRSDYSDAFGNNENAYGNVWGDAIFYPKYSIISTNCIRMFKGLRVSNFKKRLQECGVTLDTSKSKDFAQFYAYTGVSGEIPEINASSATNVTAMFCDNAGVTIIDKVVLPQDNNLGFTAFVRNCNRLKNIKFEGMIANSIDFSWSPLSVESMKSIISCLKNHIGTTKESTQTLSFTETCWTNLEASTSPYEDGLTDDETLTWKDYVMDSLGWLT